MALPIALQLYTVREETKNDFLATLEKVAELGYQGVEFAGFGDIDASVMKAHLDRLGLKAVGSHTAIDLLENELDDVINYNLTIGNSYITVPYAEYKSKEDFLSMAEKLNEWGNILKEKGLTLCYHNHDQEFEAFDGEYGLDLMYENVDSDLLKVELDIYWVKKAALDPVDYLSKYSQRTPLVHLKDMDAETGVFAEVGEGVIDIQAIIKQANKGAAEWLIVEQDICQRPALESIEISINNLKKMDI
ncbi:sugar phosphate isomerase/epimerase family protein [Natronospora cellulosivora (SeqCode)]